MLHSYASRQRKRISFGQEAHVLSRRSRAHAGSLSEADVKMSSGTCHRRHFGSLHQQNEHGPLMSMHRISMFLFMSILFSAPVFSH